MNLKHSIEKFTADIDAQQYIEKYRRADYFIKFCEQCPNYGHRWGCPPFDHDPLPEISGYSRVRIIGYKLTPADKEMTIRDSRMLLKPVTHRLNEELLELEAELRGRAYSFVGTCPYCEKEPCARLHGEPCRHPEKVRPSLEAIGFDISLTAQDVLGLEIKWGKNGLVPEYFTLVCGVFYNKP